MPHSFLKSFTAWLQFAALPPTPRRNRRPPLSRSETSSWARRSIATMSIACATFSTSAKNCLECIGYVCEKIMGRSFTQLMRTARFSLKLRHFTLQVFIFIELGLEEPHGDFRLFLHAFWREVVEIHSLAFVLAKVIDLYQALFR